MNKKINNIFLFVCWPFLTLYFNFINIDPFDRSKNIQLQRNILLFLFFFGFNYFVLSSTNSDDYRFQQAYYYFQNSIHSLNELYSYVINSKAPTEFFFPLITYFVCKSFASLQVFFIALSVFFGYFYSYNAKFFIIYSENNNYKLLKWVFLFFLLIFPFWDSINGFRFAAGSHMFFYFLTKNFDFLENKFKKFSLNYLTFFIPIFIHSSLSLAIFCFFVVILFPKYKFYFYLFLLSWSMNFFKIVDKLNLNDFVSKYNFGPEEQKKSLDGYVQKDTIESNKVFYSSLNWNIKLQDNLKNIIILIVVISLYKKINLNFKIITLEYFNLALILISIGLFLGIEVSSFARYINTGLLFLFLCFSRLNTLFEHRWMNFMFKSGILIYLILLFRWSFDLIPLNSLLPSFSIFNQDKLKLVEWWEKYGGIND